MKHKKYIPYIHSDFHNPPIKGKLLLVNSLEYKDLFTCTQLYSISNKYSPIILTEATKHDVIISRANNTQYYIFKKKISLYQIKKFYLN